MCHRSVGAPEGVSNRQISVLMGLPVERLKIGVEHRVPSCTHELPDLHFSTLFAVYHP